MKKTIALTLAIVGWITLLMRFKVAIDISEGDIVESFIQMFSFFTVLTNLLLTLYFTAIARGIAIKKLPANSFTALTVYITLVALIFNIALRPIWQPEGLRLVTSEIFHVLMPLAAVLYWFKFESKNRIAWKVIFRWLIYPLVYLVFILIRGYFSDFYPYPFFNVNAIGLQQVLINALGLVVVFAVTACIYIALARFLSKKRAAL